MPGCPTRTSPPGCGDWAKSADYVAIARYLQRYAPLVAPALVAFANFHIGRSIHLCDRFRRPLKSKKCRQCVGALAIRTSAEPSNKSSCPSVLGKIDRLL